MIRWNLSGIAKKDLEIKHTLQRYLREKLRQREEGIVVDIDTE